MYSLPAGIEIYPAHQYKTEEADAERGLGHLQELTVRPISLEIRNEAVEGKTIKEIKPLVNRDFVISRIRHCDGDRQTELVNSTTVFHIHDEILVIANPIDVEAITVFLETSECGMGFPKQTTYLQKNSDHQA